MKFYFFLILILISGCVEKKTPLVFSKSTIDKASSIESFKKTVYPIVRTHCVSCHSGSVSPFFAQENIESSHDIIIQAFKVNFTNPAESRLHRRLKNDLHNCWSNCGQNADQMLEAITTWAREAQVPNEHNRILTNQLSFSQATSRPAKLSSSLFFEAEDTVISGRVQKINLPGVSGLFAVSTPKIAEHPNSPSSRYGRMVSNCSEDNPSESYRPYAIFNEQKHYPNESGYRPYYLIMDYHLIRPDKRAEYLNLLKTKGTLERSDFLNLLWGTRGFTNNNPALPMFELDRGSSPIFINNSPSIFPDGISLEKYYQRLNANTLGTDYFANRFDGRSYYLSAQELRKKINELDNEFGFIKKALWAPLANRFKEMFFDGVNPRLVPLYNADYFSGGLTGEAGLNAVFPLPYKDAGNIVYQNGDNIIHEIDTYYYITLSLTPVVSNLSPYNSHRETRVTPLDINKSNLQILNEDFSPLANEFIYNPFVEGSTNQATYRNQIFDLNNVIMSNSALTQTVENLRFNRFSQLIHPVIRSGTNTCVNCHQGQLSNAPAFAVESPRSSFDTLKSINGLDFNQAESSALYIKMLSYHSGNNNCGTNLACETFAETVRDHLNTIQGEVNDLVSSTSGATYIKSFTDQEQKPGILRYQFEVEKTSDYRFYARVRHTGPTIRSNFTNYYFNYKITNNQGVDIPLTRKVSGVESTLPNSCSQALIATGGVEAPVAWRWSGSGASDYYKLTPGVYTLTVFEGREGIEIDELGFSEDLGGGIGELVSTTPIEVKSFSFDISALTNTPNSRFIVDVESYYGFYKFSNPRISSSEDIWINDVQILVNNFTTPYDATFKTIKKRVVANDTSSLSNSSLLVLQQLGMGGDQISIKFGEIRKAGSSDQTPAPTPISYVNGRYCRDLAYFEKNIAPIFSKTGVTLRRNTQKQDFFPRYISMFKTNSFKDRMTFDWRGGIRPDDRCIVCHSNSVPKFVMSDNIAELCQEVINRVNFADPELSVIFRGIEGQFGHATSFFLEVPSLDANGEWPDNPDSWNGKLSTWATEDIADKYDDFNSLFDPAKSAYCSPSHVTNPDDLKYLKKFIGTYKRQHFVLNDITPSSSVINTPFTNYDWAQYLLGQPVPPTSFYNPGEGADSLGLTPEQRKNRIVDLYPADYICGYGSSVPLGNRIQPGMPADCYNSDHSTRVNQCTTIMTPDGKYAQYGTSISGGSNTGSRVLHAQHLSIVPKLKPGGENGELIPTGKENVKQLIINWINREKNLRDLEEN